MVFLFRLLSRWPLAVLHALGGVLGWAVYAASAAYRQRLRTHAAWAGVDAAARRASVAQAGRMVAELPRLWLGPPVALQWDGRAHVAQALASGRGVLFLTPHLGCFEVTAQAYAAEFGAQKPMTVLFRPPRKRWLAPLVAAARQRPGLRSVPTTLAGVKQLLHVLRGGGCVGLLPDQVPPLGLGVWAPFFGHPAYTMTLAARLARQTGACVLLAWGERLPHGAGYVVHVEPPLPELPADPQQAAARLNDALQALIQRAPAQYLWAYNRYKAPRAQPPGVAD